MQAQPIQSFHILSREEPSPVTVQLTIEVDAQTTQRMFDRAVRLMGKGVRVPGFRPGQAPVNALRRLIPDEQLRRAAGELMMDEFIPKALEQAQLEPYRAPRVDIERLQEGEPFRFKVTVPLRPKVEPLGEYRDLRFPIPQQETTDEEVDQALESIREQRMRLQPAPDRPAQHDDRLVVAIKSLEDENAKPNRYMVILGQTFGELDNLLSGMRAGETQEATLTFPETFGDPNFAGKTLHVAIELQSVHTPVYPEINDEFAQSMQYSDLNDMREQLRKRITAQKMSYLHEQAQGQALATLRERSTVHLPEVLIEEQLREEARDFAEELHANGMTTEMFLQQSGMTQQQLLEQLRERGITRLQNTFILMAIADQEGIEADEQEVEALVRSMVEGIQDPAQRVRLLDDPEFHNRVRQELRLERALQKLMAIVQNTEVGA
ncbi:MAG: trigger factor [Fimbriimonadales bacterium]|nr:MAG: trigger factor [Fimbriimonadales bacterium]